CGSAWTEQMLRAVRRLLCDRLPALFWVWRAGQPESWGLGSGVWNDRRRVQLRRRLRHRTVLYTWPTARRRRAAGSVLPLYGDSRRLVTTRVRRNGPRGGGSLCATVAETSTTG